MSDQPTSRFVSRLTRKTLALILAGGRGSRLMHLTAWRSKPAIPFAGKFRIVDFPLSNSINSGIRRIAVLTQYKAHSLILHIQHGWGFLRGEFGEFVEILPAQQRVESSWYEGTADAVYQNIDIIRHHDPEYVLILGGDHIYKMDYGPMIAFHVEREADCTVGCVEVPLSDARDFGVMGVDPEGRVQGFSEKPMRPRASAGSSETVVVSMGIYVFNTAFLFEQLAKDRDMPGSNHDFGKDVIPAALETNRVVAYPFRDVQTGRQGYWRDVGTVDAYWAANIELIEVSPELNLYDNHWPVWTLQEQLPPAKFVFDEEQRRGIAIDSMVSGGCIISGATLRRSLLFSQVIVQSFAYLEEAVVLPSVVVGEGCRVRKAVLEEGCTLPAGTVIGERHRDDAERFHVTERGVVLVTPEMLGQDPRRVR